MAIINQDASEGCLSGYYPIENRDLGGKRVAW
eukprot:CAMPEP_0185264174 /NCGR_PEP_ID=MMETSP1359-20130426/20030_1 /TAXON_ID=552665 /ORGANISM="Bigelowiella longifila, Strain CCMP242" /LENGTH=31 /DNA_ID= /DNA_START= /DNA_END= /DNA_ORIENTATION=